MKLEQLYPDVVEQGGLAATLAHVARHNSIDMGTFVSPKWGDSYWDALVRSDHGTVGFDVGAARRVFLISINVEEYTWASGHTENLSDVVQVASHWREGVTLRELHTRFPFMHYTRLAQGFEDGNPIEVQWEELLMHQELHHLRPLLEAVRANARLGRMFADVTRSILRLQLDLHNRDAGEVRIRWSDFGYEVDSSWVDIPRSAASIDEAVEAAIAQLPRSG